MTTTPNDSGATSERIDAILRHITALDRQYDYVVQNSQPSVETNIALGEILQQADALWEEWYTLSHPLPYQDDEQ